MVMKRLALIVLVLLLAGCKNKPSEESCKKAIDNMRRLLGTSTYTADTSADVRRCRSRSSHASVDCAGNAKTLDDLHKCEFAHFDTPGEPTPGSGSAPGSAGSGSGSAAGSAAP
jgi:hypothetical protein